MDISPRIFREYDIRGIAGDDLTEAVVEEVGKALTVALRGKKKHNCVCIGRDGRLTSRGFSHALIDGITACGVNVIDIGEVPTPLVYYGLFTLPVDGGIQITGSHNPKEYNGMKVAIGNATIHGKAIQKLGQIAMAGKFPQARKPVTITRMDIVPQYIRRVSSSIKLKRKLKVVVDAGNGVGGPVAVPLFEKLGCEVIPMYCDVDGNFPNHHPDPTLPETLKKLRQMVKRHKADCGIAFDGDADRIGAVDEKGNILWGDQLLILFARAILKRKPNATVIGEVKCSRTLYDDVAKNGGHPIMWKTGHSLMKDALARFSGQLAGEMSGHIFFKDRWFGFDDGIYSGVRLLELLAQDPAPLSAHLADVPRMYSTEEFRIETASDERKFEIVRKATEYFKQDPELDVITTDGARIEFEDGWGLIRASNTGPILSMRFEATSPRRLKAIQALVQHKVSELNS